ncbi:MAG: hypothetical protein Q9227_003640 [Pyrenula ochraceoflavens]
MSGIEVAGLALAIFPVVISGIKAFAEGVETMRTWRRYRRGLEGYKRQLETQRIWYLDTLEELLGFVDSEEELKDLIKEPGGEPWQKPEYKVRLRERLGHSYDLYLATIDDLFDALHMFKQKLGIDEKGKVAWEDSGSFRRQAERLKVVLSKSIYMDLMAKVENANRQLRGFTHQNCHLEPTRKQRRTFKQKAPDYRVIRRSAASLHKILIQKGHCQWKCTCRTRHLISIRLEPRGPQSQASRNQILRFSLLLTQVSGQDTAQRPLKHRQELEVAPTELPEIENSFQNGSTSGNSNNLPWPTSPAPTAKRVVKFAINDNQVSPSINTSTAFSSRFSNGNCISPPPSLPITDICATLCGKKPGKEKCLGFLLDDGTHHRHDFYVAETTTLQQIDDATETLQDLLSNQHSAPFLARHLSRRDRLYIAAVLACSVLQLGGSWLKQHWSSADIRFARPSNMIKPMIDRPYVSWIPESETHFHQTSPPSDLNALTLTPTDPNSGPSSLLWSYPLMPLGLALIELSLCQSFPSLRTPSDSGSNTNMSDADLATALSLLPHVYSESGTRYGDATHTCLTWMPSRSSSSSEPDSFHSSIFETVVQPLFDDLKDFDGEARIR